MKTLTTELECIEDKQCNKFNNSLCIECKNKYNYYINNGLCKVCEINNCFHCSNDACYKCQEGYLLTDSKTCVKPEEVHCVIESNNQCIQCEEGY